MNALFFVGLVDSIVGGLSGYFKAQEGNKNIQNQIDTLNNSVNNIKDYVRQNQYSPESINEAVGRIATLYNTAGDKVSSAIRVGIESSIEQMQDAYGWSVEDINTQLNEFNDVMTKESDKFRKTWKEGFQKAQDTMVRRRLAGSEANIAFSKEAMGKLTEGEQELGERRAKVQEEFARQKTRLGQQLQSNIRTAQQQGAAQIAQSLANIELQGGERQLAERQRLEDINRRLTEFGFTQEQQANIQKSLLQGQITDPFIGALSGAAGGLGDVFGGIGSELFGKK